MSALSEPCKGLGALALWGLGRSSGSKAYGSEEGCRSFYDMTAKER